MKNYTKIFNLYSTKEGIPFYMTNRRIEFPSDRKLFIYDSKIITDNTPWTILSYQLYNSISYWWVLCSLNPEYPFYAPGGSNITYIKPRYLNDILSNIDSI